MKHTNNKLASGKVWHKANLFFIHNICDKLIRKYFKNHLLMLNIYLNVNFIDNTSHHQGH